MFLYKLFHKYKALSELEGLQWFALTKGYGNSYGNISIKYKTQRPLRLLDIGNGAVREFIEDHIKPFNEKILTYSDPNYQYSGGRRNEQYHELVKLFFGDEYDGTIIDEHRLLPGNKYSVEDLEGPTEVVLWKNHSELLHLVVPKKTAKKRTKKNKSTTFKSNS